MRRETSRQVTMSRRRLCGASGCGAWSANGNSGGPRPSFIPKIPLSVVPLMTEVIYENKNVCDTSL
jgi:hypothetical protein